MSQQIGQAQILVYYEMLLKRLQQMEELFGLDTAEMEELLALASTGMESRSQNTYRAMVKSMTGLLASNLITNDLQRCRYVTRIILESVPRVRYVSTGRTKGGHEKISVFMNKPGQPAYNDLS